MDKTNFSARRRAWGVMMRGLMVLCAVLTCALAVFLIIYVLAKGVPHLSWELLSTKPNYLEGTIGILPDIISTVCMVLTTLAVVLPGCMDGVLTGCILAVGRILGETAALLYTAGFAHTLYNGLKNTLEGSGATLSVALYVYAKEQGEFDVAFASAAILMALALLIDLAVSLTGRYFKKRRSL